MSLSLYTDRRYGFFRCGGCNGKWESSHVYCLPGSDDEYYKQECKRCQSAWEPYRVERIKCSICGLVDCICSAKEKRDRHIDKNKPHRSDLCLKCRSGLPCDVGRHFSFR